MRTFQSLKGLSVFDVETAEEIGNIQDLIFADNGTIKGILMDSNAFLQRDQIIPLDAVSGLGPDSVMVKGSEQLHSKTRNDQCVRGGKQSLLGKPIYSFEGQKLGILEDVYFDEKLGKIVGYEVTEGFFSDLSEGRRVIKTNSPLTISDKAVVVDLENEGEESLL